MPNLPACTAGGKYKIMFWTVEADPKASAKVFKEKLAQVFKEQGMLDKMHVAKEVSDTGYHHGHVVVRWTAERRFGAIAKKVQKAMKFKKENGSNISVRAFHPRRGDASQDYGGLVSYITEKKYKTAKPDPEGCLEFVSPCSFCHKEECVWVYCRECDRPYRVAGNQCECPGHCPCSGLEYRCTIRDIV